MYRFNHEEFWKKLIPIEILLIDFSCLPEIDKFSDRSKE